MNLEAVLTLQAGQFINGIAGVQRSVRSVVTGLAAMAGVGLSLAGVTAGIKKALDMGGNLSDLSARTGASVRDLMTLRQAFEDAGIGADSAGMAINQMQRALSGISASGDKSEKLFKALGLDLEALRGMGAAQQFQTIGTAIAGLASPAERTAAAMAIFGRSGGELNQLFADPTALAAAAKTLGGLPDVMERNAALFDQLGDGIGHIKTKVSGLFAGLSEGIAPALDLLRQGVESLDLVGVGQKIGNVVAVAIEAFREGRFSELVGLSLKVGFKEGINFLISAVAQVGAGLIALLGNAATWKGVGLLVLGAFEGIGGALLKIFMEPLTYLQAGMDKVVGELFEALGKIPGVRQALGLEGFQAASYDQYLKERREGGFYLKDAAEESLRLAEHHMADGAAALKHGVAGAAEIMANVEPIEVFDAQADKARLGELFGELSTKVEEQRRALQEAAAVPAPATTGAALGDLGRADRGRAAEILSDRLARVGGFVGGAGGVSHDLARRTSAATERTAKAVEQLAQAWTHLSPALFGPQEAVWARE